ncbi:hypothetical protein BCU24_21085 [Vibrio cyclitrophicus]|uniref:glycosyltransferase n=1 Tax=Vibrio cyclitrophicus TaxID=47951 RepID=UPI000C818D93|nr:glycosyltransferase [Vibrio cyclitrophicus]PMJ21413.1 hypothetical protein BCU28_10495 [Vibrio cyclitrophicus]PMJ38241.1 hypothetical protein BCU24_21085 [Vibrio cyclitrophicus]
MKTICLYSEEAKYCFEDDLYEKGVSGTLFSTMQLCIGLRDNGYKVVLIGKYPDTVSIKGILYQSISGIDSLDEFVEGSGCNVFIYIGAISSMPENRLSCEKIYYWCHNWVDFNPYLEYFNDNKLDGFIFVSYYHLLMTAVNSIKKGFLFRQLFSSRVMHNSLDLDLLNNVQEKHDDKLDFINLAFVGYPSKNKGIIDALSIASTLAKKNDVVFNIYGGKELYGHTGGVEADLSNYDCLSIVEHGTLNRLQLYPEIQKQHFLVAGLTGSETFCVSIAEGIALGVPSITSKKGGQNEIISKTCSLFLEDFEDKNCYSLNKKIENIKREIENDKNRIKNDFSRENITKRWSCLIEGTWCLPKVRYLSRALYAIFNGLLCRLFK